MLPFFPISLKVIKLGIAKDRVNSAIDKSLLHTMEKSFGYQVARLKAVGRGYSGDVVGFVCLCKAIESI